MTISTTLRSPIQAVEIDNSRAQQGPAIMPYRALILGQKLSGGTATANTLYRVTRESDASTYAGRGSMLHTMVKAWLEENASTELWIGPVADNGAGVAATGTIVFAGTATAAGAVYLYAGGKRIVVAVASGDASTAVATAVAAAMPSSSDYPASGGASSSTVTVTYRHKGAAGNEYDLRLNYNLGETLPAGITATVTAMASGATNPTLTSVIAAMSDNQFHVVAHPWTDSTNLTAIETEMARRFGAQVQIPGVAIAAKSDTHANLVTLGTARNSPHSVINGLESGYPTPSPEFAAKVAAVVAREGAADPGLPFQTLALTNVLPIPEATRFTYAERDLLLHDGVATQKVTAGEQVRIDRLITTYQTNAASAADTSYLDVTTMLILMYLRYSWRTLILATFPRAKLANDGVHAGPGQKIVTPKILKGAALGWFRQMEDLGLVENFDQFKRDLVVTRPSDPNRLDTVMAPDLINQFIVGGTTIQFKL